MGVRVMSSFFLWGGGEEKSWRTKGVIAGGVLEY